MRKLALFAGLALAATTTPALAQTVTFNGVTYTAGQTIPTISFIGQTDTGAMGALTLTFTGVGGTTGLDYLFNWTLANTSNSTQVNGANISGFGFNLSGGTLDLVTSFVNTAAPNNGSAAINTVSSGNISGGNNFLDICFTGNTCSGGANAGPTAGNTFMGTLGIEFSSTLPTNITLSNPIIRFQNTSPSGSDIGLPVPGGVPEPATWAMMLLGFGAAGMALRRNRGKALLTQLA